MLVLLFDIDGTLIDSGGAGKLAMETALAEQYGITEIRPGIPYAGRTDWAIARDLLTHHGHAGDAAQQQRLVDSYLGHLPQSLQRRNGWVLPGVNPLLMSLRAQPNVTLGLLTGNVRQGAYDKLRHFQLHEHFVTGGFADGHEHRDDVARTAYSAVETHLGRACSPNQVWVIGDTPADVQCARAIGANVVAVATGSHTVEELHATCPDLVLPDLTSWTELARVWQLQSLLRSS